jgi:hypothetical protein
VLALAAPLSAWAQQTYFVPTVEATVEGDTNRELVPIEELEDESHNYRLNALALWGRRTERSELEVRPRVQFQEFPDREGIDPVEYFFDLRGKYQALKGRAAVFARYAHQDIYNAEYGDDPFDPERSDVTSSSGIVFVGGTRETFEGEGSFLYQLSNVMGVSGLLNYRKIEYGDDFVTDRVGYQSPYGELMLTRTLGPLTEFAIGPYGTYSEAEDGSNETDTVGVRASFGYRWTDTMHVTMAAVFERSDITDFEPTLVEESFTNWGLQFTGYYRRQLSGIRYSIGRFLMPSTFGTRITKDQIRVQYVRPLSPLMTFEGAVRLTRDDRIGDDSDQDRDRALLELSLTRKLTQSWYVSGEYRYVWQDIGGVGGNADNHALLLTVGYKALNPVRRGQDE